MADLIYRDALLLKQKAHADLFADSTVHDDIVRRDEATAALAEIINAPSASRWIPCSERLPEVGIPVLIYDKHHKAFFVAKLDEDYFGFSSNMWHHPADVPFWMPLPEAPKEDDND